MASTPPITEGVPRSEPRPKKITCEFCDCALTAEGELYGKLSDKAKAFRSLEDENAKLKVKNAELQASLDAALHTDPKPDDKPAKYTGEERRKRNRPLLFGARERRKGA